MRKVLILFMVTVTVLACGPKPRPLDTSVRKSVDRFMDGDPVDPQDFPWSKEGKLSEETLNQAFLERYITKEEYEAFRALDVQSFWTR